MTKFQEAAASPAQLAHRADRGNLPIQVRVERAKLVFPAELHRAGIFTHTRRLIHLDPWQVTRQSRPPCRPGPCPTPGRLIERTPNLRAIRHFPARTAMSGIEPAARGRRCIPPSCPRKYSRRPVFRPGCIDRPPGGRTGPKTPGRSGRDRTRAASISSAFTHT